MKNQLIKREISGQLCSRVLLLGIVMLLNMFTCDAFGTCDPPVCPPCYYVEWCECSDEPACENCCNGNCCPEGTTCSNGHCCPPGQTGCGSGCCDPDNCETCVNGECMVCGGRLYEACCGGQCYDTRFRKCCTDVTPNYICDIDKTCCQGNCCQYGCCKEEIRDELWCISRGCGCDPAVGGGCGDKKEKEAGPTPIYYTSGTGSKCDIPQGKLLCYRWRSCLKAGFHQNEMCLLFDPSFPQGYCSAWLWPYCYDCEGTGLWEDEFTENSERCE